ncbi:DUF6470 family protein [Intestinibacillus sp. Marseille-P6563]|uniref:DUF6470 family protein n=1 Tax=Intestinibacillus sp. Marseille-P6563 TaxID=2364792 RepID=UPI000F06F905|nr:DUF6470 family protein [Intestinibacillus sp. Marseille-P6563]
MERLIEIKTVPIELEMKVNHARLEYKRSTVDLEISRDTGGLKIKSKPIKLNIDTFEARNSVTPTAMRSIEQAAQRGQQKVYETTATYARRGDLLLEAKIGEEMISRFAMESQQVNTDFAMQWLPSTGPDITWDAGELNIRYEMDKLNFDWRMNSGNVEFTPGNIEFTVTQQPDVIIKYIGGPVYVPPSAEPGYEPVDTKA